MKRFHISLAVIFGLLPAVAFTAFAQDVWTNGQDALYVIGQPDFTTDSFGLSEIKLAHPKDVAVDVAHGKLYVVEEQNCRVLRFSYPIHANQPAAELVFGQSDFISVSSGAAANRFDSPRGIAVDSSGRLWVSDSENNRVVWFNEAHTRTGNQPNADGVLGQPDFTSRAGATTSERMSEPFGLAISASGDLFVADAGNNRVLVFEEAAAKPDGAPADKVLGQPDFTTNIYTTTQSGMDTPRGVALFGDSLFVADRDNARVLRFDDVLSKPNGANADGVLGQPDFISDTTAITQAGMDYPGRLAADLSGRLYVSDGFSADRITVFVDATSKPDGGPADYVLGQPDFTSQVAATDQNSFDMDSHGGGMAVDSVNGYLLAADDNNHRVMVFKSIAPLAAPVLGIEKSGPAFVPAGEPIWYTLSITNTGNLTATNLIISDTLPVGASYLDGGTLDPDGFVSWALPALGIGDSEQVQFAVTASQTITNSDYSVTCGEGVTAVGLIPVVTSDTMNLYLPLVKQQP